MEMAALNRYFKKRKEHRVTYKSGRRSAQIDYISYNGVHGDIRDQEGEYSKGRAKDQMMEIEEGRLLYKVQVGDKTGSRR